MKYRSLKEGSHLDFLNLLKNTRLHECYLGFEVLRQDFGKLEVDVGKDVVGCKKDELIEGGGYEYISE